MKKYFLLMVMVCGVMISSCSSQSRSSLKPQDFSEKIKADSVLILDVRTPGEYSKGHIKNSMLIDYLDDSFAERVSKLDKNKTVYVYCHSGGRSSEAQQEMQKQGFRNVINLEGGITAWEKAGLPVEK